VAHGQTLIILLYNNMINAIWSMLQCLYFTLEYLYLVQGTYKLPWYLHWWYNMRYKKSLILFSCTSHGLLICHEEIVQQYKVGTNEMYKLFLYLTTADIAKCTQRPIHFFVTDKYQLTPSACQNDVEHTSLLTVLLGLTSFLLSYCVSAC